jgi:type IV pilus assembly protein PilF
MRLPFIAIACALLAAALTGCETTTTVNGQPVANPGELAQVSDADARKRASIRLQLASSYYQQRQFAVALQEVRKALEIDPNLAAGHSMLGLIHLDLDDRAQAEASFGRALRLEPDNPEIGNSYGWFLCRTGRERESIEHFQRAAANRLYATPAMALQNAGVCLMQLRDYKGAEPFLRRSFESDAGSPMIKFQLARLYLATRQLERANFYYSLLERDVDASAETLWLGLRIARAQGDVRGERQYSDQLLRRFPNSPEAGAQRRGQFDD